jgi:hypothetical protein
MQFIEKNDYALAPQQYAYYNAKGGRYYRGLHWYNWRDFPAFPSATASPIVDVTAGLLGGATGADRRASAISDGVPDGNQAPDPVRESVARAGRHAASRESRPFTQRRGRDYLL